MPLIIRINSVNEGEHVLMISQGLLVYFTMHPALILDYFEKDFLIIHSVKRLQELISLTCIFLAQLRAH